jgi:cytochrome P450
MPEVTALDLPELDFFDTGLRGERFHRTMQELSEAGWVASSPIGYFVLDRESAAFFLRTKSATFPGMKIAEMFEVPEGPLLEQMRRNILHINGDDHRRLRNLVNPAFTPRSADKWRPAMRDFLERL